MNHFVASLLLLTGIPVLAQKDSLPPPTDIRTLPSNDGSLTRLDDQPTFPGGEAGLVEYMRANVQYPDAVQRAGVSGTVLVAFTIADDGRVHHARVQQGIPKGEALNMEALRVVNSMPRWEPAHVRGVAVPVEYVLPITFALQQQPR